MLKKNQEDSTSLCVSKDSNGETALHKTAKGGYLKCLKFLASQVSDQVSSLDNSDMTPAAHAAKVRSLRQMLYIGLRIRFSPRTHIGTYVTVIHGF